MTAPPERSPGPATVRWPKLVADAFRADPDLAEYADAWEKQS